MIFITGGNFQFLDASAPIYESERFVNTTNIVVVLIQYRLGKKIRYLFVIGPPKFFNFLNIFILRRNKVTIYKNRKILVLV
jgi:hypothetical protein